MHHLILMKNQTALGRYPLKPGMNTIGRSKDQDIIIEDENVTRNHARIQVDVTKKIFLFEDLGSLNGSYINNIKTNKHLLRPDDIIQMGMHHIIFTDSVR